MRFLVFIFAFLFIAAIFFVRDEILSKRAKIIATALIAGVAGTADDETLAGLRGRVRALTDAFPLYPGLAQ